MPEVYRLGPYAVVQKGRGLELTREKGAMQGPCIGVLAVAVTESQGPEVLTTYHRLRQISDHELRLEGSATDHVTIEATLVYRREFDGLDFDVRLVNSTDDMALRVTVTLELPGEAEPHWMIPGLLYGENRVRECKRIYPGYSEIARDPNRFISNEWKFRSDRTAMPLVCCTTYNIFAFLATTGSVGANKDNPAGRGVTSVGLNAALGYPLMTVDFPIVEEPVKYSYCREDKTAPADEYFLLAATVPLELSVQLGFLPVAENTWDMVYRALYEDRWPVHSLRPKLSSIEAEHLAVEGLFQWHFDEEYGMIHETAAFDKHFGRRGTNVERTHMHVGWLSGALPAYVFLWHGRDAKDPIFVRHGTRTLDLIVSQLAPCGTLWPLFTLEEGFQAGFGPEQGLAHSRTIGEAVLFLMRSLRREMAANTSHPKWWAAIQRNLDFIVANQREDGAFPAYWALNDGRIASYDGAAGMAWIPSLLAADALLPHRRYHEAAIKAGNYYAAFVERNFIYGMVEDLPLVPTADDAHWATIAYVILYERDRDELWLKLARQAANLALTFRLSYNIGFHPASMLSGADFSTRGGDISSVATPTLGCCGLISYGEMLKLSALCDDPYYATRAREARTFATQLMARCDGMYNARQGMSIGQVFHTDWWQPKGMVLSLGHAMTAALVKHTELVERTLHIPISALQGDPAGIEQASRSSIVSVIDEVEMPESIAARREREKNEQRRRRRVAARPVTEYSEFTSRISQLMGLSSEDHGADDALPAAASTTRPVGDDEDEPLQGSIPGMPMTPSPRRRNVTPLPEESPINWNEAFREDSGSGSQVYEEPPTQSLNVAASSRPSYSKEPTPLPLPYEEIGRKRDIPADQLKNVPPPPPRFDSANDILAGLMQSDSPPAPKRPQTGGLLSGLMDDDAPPPPARRPPTSAGSSSSVNRIPPPPPTAPPSNTADVLSGLMQDDRRRASMANVPPPPPPSGGLLSGLMDDEAQPRQQPGGPSSTPPPTSHPTPPPGGFPFAPPRPKPKAEEEVEIKWKIF